MLKPLSKRAPEIATNLNPALGSLILWEFVSGYETNDISGVDYPLIFFPLPLVLHKETRSIMPRDQRTRLQVWINENPQIEIGLADRITQLAPFVKEALLLAVNRGLLDISSNAKIKKALPIPTYIRQNCSSEVKEILEKSALSGKWFAQIADTTTILLTFGVKI